MSNFIHPRFVSDIIDIENYTQANFTYTATAGQSAALAEGVYDIWSNQDCYIKVAATANDVTTGTGYLLRANTHTPVYVRQNSKIGAIRSATDGTFYLHKVG